MITGSVLKQGEEMTTKNVVTARDLESCMKDLFSTGKFYTFDQIHHELLKQYPFPNITEMLGRLIGQGNVHLVDQYDPTSSTHGVYFQINTLNIPASF